MTKTYFYICIGCSVLGSIALLIFAISGFFYGAFLSLLFDILLWSNFFLIGRNQSLENGYRELVKIAMDAKENNGALLHQVELMKAKIEAIGESPSTEAPSVGFKKGDQVLVSERHFDDEDLPPQHGVVTGVLDEGCIVLITEKESIYDDVEFFVSNEYITKT